MSQFLTTPRVINMYKTYLKSNFDLNQTTTAGGITRHSDSLMGSRFVFQAKIIGFYVSWFAVVGVGKLVGVT